MFWGWLSLAWAEPAFTCTQLASQQNLKTDIQVVELAGTVQYHRLPGRVLQYRAEDSLALGFTESEFKSSIELHTVIYEDEEKICVFLSAVHFSLGYSHQKVFIDERYPAHSCAYQAILDHENEHVAINEQVLQKYKPQIFDALQRYYSDTRPLMLYRGAEVDAAVDAWLVQKRSPPKISSFKRRIQKEREKANKAIDTPKSYRRVRQRCSDW